MRSRLHPVSADARGRFGAGDHSPPSCGRSPPPGQPEGAGLAVGLAPPSGGPSSPSPAGTGLLVPVLDPRSWVPRRRAGPESLGGFSALWKWERGLGWRLWEAFGARVWRLGWVGPAHCPLPACRWPSPELGTGLSSAAWAGWITASRDKSVLRALIFRPGGG